jgi:hypothetical protein
MTDWPSFGGVPGYIPNPSVHRAIRDAMVRLSLKDPTAFPSLTSGEFPFEEIAHAIAQRVALYLAADGWHVTRNPSGKGRVTDRRFDQRLRENRQRKTERP